MSNNMPWKLQFGDIGISVSNKKQQDEDIRMTSSAAEIDSSFSCRSCNAWKWC